MDKKPPKEDKRNHRGTSSIWMGFIKVDNQLEKDLIWQVRNAENISIGIDPILGLDENYKLSVNILVHLKEYGMYTLNKLNKTRIKNEPSDYWFSAKYMGFEGQEYYGCNH